MGYSNYNYNRSSCGGCGDSRSRCGCFGSSNLTPFGIIRAISGLGCGCGCGRHGHGGYNGEYARAYRSYATRSCGCGCNNDADRYEIRVKDCGCNG